MGCELKGLITWRECMGKRKTTLGHYNCEQNVKPFEKIMSVISTRAITYILRLLTKYSVILSEK